MNNKCRTCLKCSTKTFPISKVVTGCDTDITYAELLMEYGQFEYNATYEPHLPQFICFLCSSQLKSTYLFIQQAQKCNEKLIKDITKQLCLQEKVIDLPPLQDVALSCVKEENSDNHSVVKDQNMNNSSSDKGNRNNEDDLVIDNSFVKEPSLTTEEIIEYDSGDNSLSNNSFTAEPAVKTEQIIEFDVENNLEMENENSNFEFSKDSTIANNKENSLSDQIQDLDSEDSLPETHFNEEESQSANKTYKCKSCDYIAKSYSGLQYHNTCKHKTENDKFKCKFCSYTTLIKFYLFKHIKNTHKELIRTLKTDAINNTEESINDDKQDKEEISDEDFIRNIINMKRKPRLEPSKKQELLLAARCDECGKILKTNRTLRNHKLNVHKSEDMYSACPHCDRKCKRESDLRVHIRQIHGPKENRQIPKPRSKEKRYMCAECSYTCKTSNMLNAHIRIHHTGERPYVCDICSKTFAVRSRLRIHRNIHTNERPYKCPVCSKGFNNPSHLRVHKRIHGNKQPYTCEDCGKSFSHSFTLGAHRKKHLKENQLYCTVCDKVFENKSMLNIHQINENHYEEVA